MVSSWMGTRGGQDRTDGLRRAFSVGPKAQDWGKHWLKLSSDSLRAQAVPSRRAAQAGSDSRGVQMEPKTSGFS